MKRYDTRCPLPFYELIQTLSLSLCFNVSNLQVLDEEAEVFVVKMWRLLIYELDAKKSGLAGK